MTRPPHPTATPPKPASGPDASNWWIGGGSSLSAPLVAAYYALVDNTEGPEWAYDHANGLNDITSGTNGTSQHPCPTTNQAFLCTGGPGYDGPTGNGSISGDAVPGPPGIGGPTAQGGSNASCDYDLWWAPYPCTPRGYTVDTTPTTATLQAGIYPNGYDTQAYWQYGDGTGFDYDQQTPTVDVGSTMTSPGVPPELTTTITGLSPGTTYHYRLVAQNIIGPPSVGYEFTFTTPDAYDSAVLSDHPGNFWKMNETSGTAATDSSGSNDTGTYATGITLGESGPMSDPDSGSISLPSGSSATTEFSAPVSSTEATTANGLSGELWVKPPAQGYPSLSMTLPGEFTFSFAAGAALGGEWQPTISIFNGSQTQSAGGNSYPFTGGWQLVDFTWNASTCTTTLYINGTEENSQSSFFCGFSGPGTDTQSEPLTISSYPGQVADLSLYPETLSATQIQAHYSAAQ